MLGDSGLSIVSQLLSIVQPKIEFLMMACHILDGSDNLQKRRQGGSIRKKKMTTQEFALKKKVKTFQLCYLVEIMVAHVHSVLDHALVGLIVQIAGEEDRVLF